MKRWMWSLAAVGLLGMAGAARAQVVVDAGVQLWYAEPKVTDRSLMYGPEVSMDIGEQLWVRGHYLYGEYDYIRSREPRRVQDFGIHDAELRAGFKWDIFQFGAGFRWLSVVIEEPLGEGKRVRRPNAFGPVLSAGASQSLSEWPWGIEGSPWGWYAGAAWMIKDLEDDDGEHLVLEAGITHAANGFHKRLGYRFRETFDHQRMEGFTASLTFEF